MKRLILILAIMLGLATFSTFASGTVLAATDPQVCEGIGATGGASGCQSTGNSIEDIMAIVINVFSWVVGAVAVIFAIYAGFLYITSGGDQGKIKSAKDTLLYVVIGLVVVVLSQILVNFVLKRAS